MVTPFIKPIKLDSGTLIISQSSQNDLNYIFDNSTYKFKFSNFVLLKLPPLKKLLVEDNSIFNNINQIPNYIQLESILGSYSNWYDALSGNVQNFQNNNVFTESFQNYVLNFETIFLNEKENDEKINVFERIFFKWLKEIGAIRFRQANITEISNFGDIKFVEEDNSFNYNSKPIYERVVKYIGEIDVINNVRHNKNSFTEIYIYIPTNHGNTIDILFNSYFDSNYYPEKVFQTKNKELNKGYLEEREYDDIHPAGLLTKAFFDSNITGNNTQFKLWYYNKDSGQFVDENDNNFYWWFDLKYLNSNSYICDSSFGNTQNDVFAISKNSSNPNNPIQTTDVVKFVRNRLDGIMIDFNINNYYKAKINNYSSFSQFNSIDVSNDFDFNVILIYYDLIEQKTGKIYKNLFGVLFLDGVKFIPGDGGYISTFKKYKTNSLLKRNGNSYGFKLNIKFNANNSEVQVESDINEYNNFSLQLYIDALNEMKKIISKYDNILNEYFNLKNEINSLKDLYFSSISYGNLVERIEKLENKVEEAKNVFLNNENLINLINKNYEEIKNIYENKTSIEMSYNLNTIHDGDGINIDRSEKNIIKINNSNYGYNINNNSFININDYIILENSYNYFYELVNYDNYIKFYNIYNEDFITNKNLNLFINDKFNKWKKGQKIKISFDVPIILNNFNGNFTFSIYTKNLNEIYNHQIAILTSSEFNENNNYKPIIEIICIDDNNLNFTFDILK